MSPLGEIGVIKAAFAEVEEFALEEELVPVPAARRSEEERAAAEAPLFRSCPLNEELAAEFLAEEFLWGENGEQFLSRFGSEPSSVTELAGADPDFVVWLPRIREAISRACHAGLLTAVHENGQELYSSAEGVDIRYLVLSRKIERHAFNEEAAEHFLSEGFSAPGTDLRPISGRCFLALFERGYTMTDLFEDCRLYKEGEVNFSMPVRSFLTGLVNRAFECGLLERRYGSGTGGVLQEVYYPATSENVDAMPDEDLLAPAADSR